MLFDDICYHYNVVGNNIETNVCIQMKDDIPLMLIHILSTL